MTYGDATGAMGETVDFDNKPDTCLNAAKSWQTGWYNSKRTVVTPSSIRGDECFDKDLYGIADFENPHAQNVLVKINDPGFTDYYVTFNRKAGINNGTREAADQVTVTRSSLDGGYQKGNSASDLVAKLGSGDEYFATIDGKNMTVNVENIGTSSARVGICSCPSSKSAKTPVRIVYELCLHFQPTLSCISDNANSDLLVNREGQTNKERNKGQVYQN